MDAKLLKILCCPESRQELREAGGDLVREVNERIRGGTVKNRGGQPVTEPIEGGLVREDGQYLYPIRKNIPVLLVDEAIPVAGA
jgi:uncharacterized protein YbaR (Trm112 family)